MTQEVERSAKLVDDPVPAEYINPLDQNLARNSGLKVPVPAKLIDSAQVNAFARPGGFLFVNTEGCRLGPSHDLSEGFAGLRTRSCSSGTPTLI